MIALVAVLSFLITILGLPTLIQAAKMKRLVDEPADGRKIHHRTIPTIGGVIIFIAIMFNSLFFESLIPTGTPDGLSVRPILNACMVFIFFMGLKDDIMGMAPSKKLIVHLLIGSMLIGIGDYRISSFGGLFGIYELTQTLSFVFSLFVYIVIVNAWNLIDGVDGLAAGYTVIAMSGFAYWFLKTGAYPEAILALTAGGSALGFLMYNFAPARIFMGDCGSLMLGLTGYVLATRMMATPTHAIPPSLILVSKQVLAMGILAYPLVDTLRVFCMRATRGISPFHPDCNHLHHRLMMHFGTHRKTAIFVYGYSIIFGVIPLLLPYLNLGLYKEISFFGLLLAAFLVFLPILAKTREKHRKITLDVQKKNAQVQPDLKPPLTNPLSISE